MTETQNSSDTQDDWAISLETKTRADLIDLSIVFARAMPAALFHDTDDIPIIAITGYQSLGKSMVVEAMMKTLLDDHDPEDMKKPGAKDAMFLEEHPSQAGTEYLSISAAVQGKPASLAFDRYVPSIVPFFPDNRTLNDYFQILAKGEKGDKTGKCGAIFITDTVKMSDIKPLIKFEITGNAENWERSTSIKINALAVRENSEFQAFWARIKQQIPNDAVPSCLAQQALAMNDP